MWIPESTSGWCRGGAFQLAAPAVTRDCCSRLRTQRGRPIPDRTARYTSTRDRKSTRLNSSHLGISYAVFCLKKRKTKRSTQKLDTARCLSVSKLAVHHL